MLKIKVRKNLGLGFIIAAFPFLFNPDIAIIDVLPDVIGYCFMLIGLSELSLINDKIRDASSYFAKAAVCSLVKILLVFILFGLVTEPEMPVSMLLFSFVMSLLDLIFLIPAYRNLFGGLIYLGERHGGAYVLKCRANGRRSTTEKMCSFTIAFVIIKAVSPVLPELTSLLDYENTTSLVNYYDFINLYRIAAFALMLVIGLIWLVRVSCYFASLRRDREFVDSLVMKYREEIVPDRAYFVKKHVSHISVLLSVAAAFTVHLYFDSYNLIPGVICAVLFGIAAVFLREYTKRSRYLLAASVLLFVSSSVLEFFRISFFGNYIVEQVQRNPKAYEAWQKLFAASVGEAVCMSLLVVAAVAVLWDAAHRYTGIYTSGTDSFDPETARRELHRELCRPMIATAVIGVCAAFMSAVYVYGMSVRLEAVWIAEALFGAVFAVRYSVHLRDVIRQINFRHFSKE